MAKSQQADSPFFMARVNIPTPLFSAGMDAASARSLSMLFLLQEFITTRRIDKLCFYCQILLQTSAVGGEKIAAMMQKGKFEKELFKALFPFFSESRFDENLLSWLLENQEKLNGCFGKRQVNQLLSLLAPEGVGFLQATIAEGYRRRGFACKAV
jgi:hypothetical protein